MSPRRCSSVPRSQRWRRPDAHWLNPVGFSFALAGLGQLLILPFKHLFFEGGRTEESGGPSLFEPSLKVEGDIGHIKPLDFALTKVIASQSINSAKRLFSMSRPVPLTASPR